MRLQSNTFAKQNFILKIDDGKTSCLRRLRYGISQKSCLAALLFNVYIGNLPDTAPPRYVWADDLTLLFALKICM